MNFWQSLTKPIMGLSPMDGVTDSPFRRVVDTIGKPSVLFTEFVSVDAIMHNPHKALASFEKYPTKTPTVAQLYGRDLDAYRWATIAACELGFDGIDINMGCPAKSIATRGAGAGLIREPAYARQIIHVVYETAEEWFEGGLMLEIIPKPIQDAVIHMKRQQILTRKLLPISVKTRIGYDSIATEEWIMLLSSCKLLSALTLHGRTFTQGYRGSAKWDEIEKGALIAKSYNPHIIFLGNGDITSRQQAKAYVDDYKLDGVLIGRAALGNPWVFTDTQPTRKERVLVALEHARLLTEDYPHKQFITLRKHMPWYMSGHSGDAELRSKLSKISNKEELENILMPILLSP